MQLFVGLGNPGAGYAGNRHNAGFMAIDAMASRWGIEGFQTRFDSQIAKGMVDGHELLLARPQTFMNLSGRAVQQIFQFYKLKPQELTVIHDELDLELGRLRIKRGGGNGGHNGLKSIDAAIGHDYRRVRIGIGHPGIREMVTSHVLHDFSPQEGEAMQALLARLADSLPLLLAGEDARAMNAVAA